MRKGTESRLKGGATVGAPNVMRYLCLMAYLFECIPKDRIFTRAALQRRKVFRDLALALNFNPFQRERGSNPKTRSPTLLARPLLFRSPPKQTKLKLIQSSIKATGPMPPRGVCPRRSRSPLGRRGPSGSPDESMSATHGTPALLLRGPSPRPRTPPHWSQQAGDAYSARRRHRRFPAGSGGPGAARSWGGYLHARRGGAEARRGGGGAEAGRGRVGSGAALCLFKDTGYHHTHPPPPSPWRGCASHSVWGGMGRGLPTFQVGEPRSLK